LKDHINNLENPQNPFFGPDAIGKLMTNERTRKYFEQPDFKNKWDLCLKNP
jgi:hypothetical protein